MDDRALADRLVSYADALVAVSFVGMSGLSIALADPDVRCSIADGLVPIMAGNVIFASVVSYLLRTLRKWETDLRADSPLSTKAADYSRRLYSGRFVVVWFSAIAAVSALAAVTRDPSCLQ